MQTFKRLVRAGLLLVLMVVGFIPGVLWFVWDWAGRGNEN